MDWEIYGWRLRRAGREVLRRKLDNKLQLGSHSASDRMVAILTRLLELL